MYFTAEYQLISYVDSGCPIATSVDTQAIKCSTGKISIICPQYGFTLLGMIQTLCTKSVRRCKVWPEGFCFYCCYIYNVVVYVSVSLSEIVIHFIVLILAVYLVFLVDQKEIFSQIGVKLGVFSQVFLSFRILYFFHRTVRHGDLYDIWKTLLPLPHDTDDSSVLRD